MKLSFIIVLTLSFISCSSHNEPPERLIEEDTYINLMIELQLLRSYQVQSQTDSTAVDSLMQAVFKKYGVTQKQFKKSHKYYQNQLGKQSERIDAAIDRLRKDRVRKTDSTRVDTTNTR